MSRKFIDRPFDDENDQGLEIQVLGEGCVLCNSLENDVMEVLSKMSLTADLEHVRDVEEIEKYNVKCTPALIINGKVIYFLEDRQKISSENGRKKPAFKNAQEEKWTNPYL